MDDTRNQAPTVDRAKLIELTAEIVSAYVANNSVRPADLPDVIRTVAASLQMNEQREEKSAATPAVPVRKSVAKDHLVCLVCGRKQKTLKRHLLTAHGVSPAEYRERFGLGPDYPMVAPAYSTARSEMAKRLGLGRRRAAEPAEEDETPRRRGRRGRQGQAA